ncbi:hypothetical protein AX774_g3056 [Zancudomyces culisetae]|uniref:Uncharacterized protein n=1 Tax=Zancudomyces culisetae TaxID=1213189 RepID=A0A1R1PR50_ZANCU|nr:hypothetical protein AX774_g3056 [Zancudomyces culisetae]|eukprot:OMH83437.1 hypothetical protein AX774_g3056 [Zancudomyces culisetae]
MKDSQDFQNTAFYKEIDEQSYIRKQHQVYKENTKRKRVGIVGRGFDDGTRTGIASKRINSRQYTNGAGAGQGGDKKADTHSVRTGVESSREGGESAYSTKHTGGLDSEDDWDELDIDFDSEVLKKVAETEEQYYASQIENSASGSMRDRKSSLRENLVGAEGQGTEHSTGMENRATEAQDTPEVVKRQDSGAARHKVLMEKISVGVGKENSIETQTYVDHRQGIQRELVGFSKRADELKEACKTAEDKTRERIIEGLQREIEKIVKEKEQSVHKLEELKKEVGVKTGEVETVRRRLYKVEEENVKLQEQLANKTQQAISEKKSIEEKYNNQTQALRTELEFHKHEVELKGMSRKSTKKQNVSNNSSNSTNFGGNNNGNGSGGGGGDVDGFGFGGFDGFDGFGFKARERRFDMEFKTKTQTQTQTPKPGEKNDKIGRKAGVGAVTKNRELSRECEAEEVSIYGEEHIKKYIDLVKKKTENKDRRYMYLGIAICKAAKSTTEGKGGVQYDVDSNTGIAEDTRAEGARNKKGKGKLNTSNEAIKDFQLTYVNIINGESSLESDECVYFMLIKGVEYFPETFQQVIFQNKVSGQIPQLIVIVIQEIIKDKSRGVVIEFLGRLIGLLNTMVPLAEENGDGELSTAEKGGERQGRKKESGDDDVGRDTLEMRNTLIFKYVIQQLSLKTIISSISSSNVESILGLMAMLINSQEYFEHFTENKQDIMKYLVCMEPYLFALPETKVDSSGSNKLCKNSCSENFLKFIATIIVKFDSNIYKTRIVGNYVLVKMIIRILITGHNRLMEHETVYSTSSECCIISDCIKCLSVIFAINCLPNNEMRQNQWSEQGANLSNTRSRAFLDNLFDNYDNEVADDTNYDSMYAKTPNLALVPSNPSNPSGPSTPSNHNSLKPEFDNPLFYSFFVCLTQIAKCPLYLKLYYKDQAELTKILGN